MLNPNTPRGVAPLAKSISAKLLSNAGMRALFFPFSEWGENAAATTVSDLSGTAVAIPVDGTTAGLGATPSLGVTLTTDNHIWLNNLVSGLDMEFINSIYDCTNGFDRIVFFAADVTIAAAPASDVTNYLLSMGKRDDVNPDAWGQLCVRLNLNRKPNWHLRTRRAVQTNEVSGSSTAIATGTPTSIFGVLLPGTTANSIWYMDGVLDNTGNIASIDTMGPLAESNHGIALMGATSNNSPFTPQSRFGAGTVAPTARNMLIGKCSYNAANQVLLPQLAMYLAKFKRLPAWIDQIT